MNGQEIKRITATNIKKFKPWNVWFYWVNCEILIFGLSQVRHSPFTMSIIFINKVNPVTLQQSCLFFPRFKQNLGPPAKNFWNGGGELKSYRGYTSSCIQKNAYLRIIILISPKSFQKSKKTIYISGKKDLEVENSWKKYELHQVAVKQIGRKLK